MPQAYASRIKLNEAIQLINAGQADKAETLCRDAVMRDPRDVNMVALLGATLFKTRQNREAEKFLREAIELAPNFSKPHEDLGTLLLEEDRPEEAVAMLQNATRLDPKAELAFFNLGKAQAMLGEGAEADKAFEASFELNPERKKLALAAEHHRNDRFKEAQQLYREILRENPNNVDAVRLLGTIAASQSRMGEAERRFRRAIELAPDYVRVIIDLGRILKDQSRYQEAIDCFRQAITLEPGNVQSHFQLASTLAPAALTYEAVEVYQRVLELQPKHPGALLGLAHMLKTVGRQDEAVTAYRDFIRLTPDHGEGYWSLANLKTYRLTDEDTHEMEMQLAKDDLTDLSAVNFMFALAKTYEDQDDYDRAWDYYNEGNAKRRMLEQYDPVKTEITNDSIISVFDRQFLEQNAGLGNPDPAPIFVVGLPRSGSTLIEQILASHSMVEGTAELPYAGRMATSLNRNRADGINYPEAARELGEKQFKAMGQEYLDLAQLHRTEGKPRFIDKMPNNTPTIGLLHLILPNAKFIDARRYPLDSCFSCYRQLFAQGQSFTYDLTDIGEYFLQYERMMDHWHDVLPGRVLTVQYEDIVTDSENQIRRLLEYCELPWEDACINFYETERPVRTASSEQVRQPIYSKSINRWRKYEQHLSELIEVLEPSLPRYSQYESINRT
jgi:tetratricopeptide (TPR) repeat protein